MYFAKNQGGYKIECSPVALAQWGIKRSSYKDAFTKLKDLGYLEEKKSNYYIFHEKPIPVEKIIVEIDKSNEGFTF